MSATLRFHASDAQAEINVTPLIDVLLALVVILMIAAPLTMKKLSVPLAGGNAAPTPRTATLSVLSTGEFFLDGNAVSRAQLDATLGAWANAPQQPVLAVRADRDTSYDKVADALAIAQRSGLAGVKVEGIGGE